MSIFPQKVARAGVPAVALALLAAAGLLLWHHPLYHVTTPNLVALLTAIVASVLLSAEPGTSGQHPILAHLYSVHRHVNRRETYLIILTLALAAVWVVFMPALTGAGLMVAAAIVLSIDRNLYSAHVTSLIKLLQESLAHSGIKVGNFARLLEFRAVSYAVFERSATLSLGATKVSSIIPVQDLAGDTCLAMSAALLTSSDTAVARALRAELTARKLTPMGEIEDKHDLPDQGGAYGSLLGRKVIFGNARYLAGQKVDLLPVSNWLKVSAASGEIGMFLAIEDKVEGLIAFKDEVNPAAVPAINFFKSRGIKTVAITSDNSAAAEPLKNSFGLDEVVPNKTAPEKTQYLSELAGSGRQVMFITRSNTLTGRTHHDAIAVLLTTPAEYASSPNEITFAGDLELTPRLFAVADTLYNGLFEMNNTMWLFTVTVMCVALLIASLNQYLGLIAAAAINLASPRLYELGNRLTGQIIRKYLKTFSFDLNSKI